MAALSQSQKGDAANRMLSTDEIELIIKRAAKNLQQAAKSATTGKKVTAWGDAHVKSVEYARQIEVHSEIGAFPEELMRAKAPNETQEEIDYRRNAYESITVPYFHRAEGSLSRIWADQNYVVKYNDETLEEYFTKKYPLYGSAINFFQSVVTKKKIRDPNAVLAIEFDIPKKPNSEGEEVYDQAASLMPYACIYESHDVLIYEDEDYCLLMSEEKSEVYFGNSKDKVHEGVVMYLYDDENIYRIFQIEKKIDWKFAYEVYYKHDLGYMPAWKLKGIPEKVYENNPVYQSYFISCVPYLNTAVKMNSTLDCSIAKVAFPIRAYYGTKCKAQGCSNGMIYEAGKEPHKCPTCGGAGVMKFSPLRDHVQDAPTATDQIDQMPFPSITYVSPDAAILEFSRNKIKEDIVAAFTFINIDVTSRADSNGTQTSATEIKIDRDEFYTFLLTISNELFWLFNKFADTTAKLMGKGDVTVSAPKQFDLTTSAQLTTELGVATLPTVAKAKLNVEYLAKRFPQDGNIVKIGEIVELVDAYAYNTPQEIIMFKGAGVIQLWQVILHNEILNFIADEVDKDEKFLEKDYQAIKTTLIALAKTQAATFGTNTADKLLNDLGQPKPAGGAA